MSYRVETTEKFDREFKKLDKYTQKIIKAWIVKNLDNCDNPRRLGKPLVGDKKELWRYRIGAYRLLCVIEDDKLVILALGIGHRKEIYKKG